MPKWSEEKQENTTFQKLEKEEVQVLMNEDQTRVCRLNTHLQSLQQKLYGAAPHRDHAHLQRGADARPHICLQAGPHSTKQDPGLDDKLLRLLAERKGDRGHRRAPERLGTSIGADLLSTNQHIPLNVNERRSLPPCLT